MKLVSSKSKPDSDGRRYVKRMLKAGFSESYLAEAEAIFKKIEHLKSPEKEIQLVRLVLAKKDQQLHKAA